ncbi:MAG: TIGR03943 family protein [Desulfamplus sp.]|nr:TIGR03943 family protein [Desulfamplus sp.]
MTETIIHFFRFLYRHLPYFVYIVWLNLLGWLLYSENYKAYLQPGLYPFLMIGTVVLVLFLVSFIFSRSPMTIKPLHSLIMLIPAIFLYASYGMGLGVQAFSKKNTASDNLTELSLSSGIYQSSDNSQNVVSESGIQEKTLTNIIINVEKLKGQHILTQGIISKKEELPAGYAVIFRYAVTCCAADAVPVWVLVRSDKTAFPEDGNWVKINGILQIEELQGERLPVIMAEKIIEIPKPKPKDQYIFEYN